MGSGKLESINMMGETEFEWGQTSVSPALAGGDLLEGLNEEQQRAVTHTDGPLRRVEGVGDGVVIP